MKIGIIGSGNMGRAVGVRLAHLGHQVFFGARRAEQADHAAALAGNGALAGSTDAAAQFGEILIWTIRTPDPKAVFQSPHVLDSKVILDLNNRDYANDVQGAAWFDTAIAETLQAAAPSAHVVKALNTIAMETFDTAPDVLHAEGAQTFLAGDRTAAKQSVGLLVQDLGFQPVDLGSGPAAMRAAEAMGDIIRLLMIDGGHGGTAHLKLVSLPKPDLATIGARTESAYH
ncbi:MAG: NAD(P)-binding domain-containing protein [Pseudomonadota bacterium]